MEAVAFEVPGKPTAKGRPRFARRGQFVATYSDAKTASYEALVGWYAMQAMAGRNKFEGALKAEIVITLPIPQSWSKKKRAAAFLGEILPTGKPDLDNFLKAAVDGMNGIVYADDAQICMISASKNYGETQGMHIAISRLC